jgi:hypothetical protein
LICGAPLSRSLLRARSVTSSRTPAKMSSSAAAASETDAGRQLRLMKARLTVMQAEVARAEGAAVRSPIRLRELIAELAAVEEECRQHFSKYSAHVQALQTAVHVVRAACAAAAAATRICRSRARGCHPPATLRPLSYLQMLTSFSEKQAGLTVGRASLVRRRRRCRAARCLRVPRLAFTPPASLPSRAQPEPSAFLDALRRTFAAPRAAGASSSSSSGAARLDFAAFGRAFSSLVFDAPQFSPLLGPLSLAPKGKKEASAAAAARKALAAAEAAARPGGKAPLGALLQLDAEAAVTKAEAQNAQRSVRMYAQLFSLHKARPDLLVSNVRLEDVDGLVRRPLIRMIPALFDGWSYTQTVENLFYFSFLVKVGQAGVFMQRAHADGRPGEPLLAVYSTAEAMKPDLLLDEADAGEEEEGDDEGGGGGAAAASSAAGRVRRVVVKKPSAAHSAGAQRAAGASLAFLARQFIVHIDPESYGRIVDAFQLKGAGYRPALDHYKSTDSQAPPGFAYASIVSTVVAAKQAAEAIAAADAEAAAAVAEAAAAARRAAAGGKRARAAAAADDEDDEDDGGSGDGGDDGEGDDAGDDASSDGAGAAAAAASATARDTEDEVDDNDGDGDGGGARAAASAAAAKPAKKARAH